MEETSGGVTEDRTTKSQIALTEYLMLYNESKVFGSMRTRHRQGRGRSIWFKSDAGCDETDPSIREAAGVRRDGSGPSEEEEEDIESERATQPAALWEQKTRLIRIKRLFFVSRSVWIKRYLCVWGTSDRFSSAVVVFNGVTSCRSLLQSG